VALFIGSFTFFRGDLLARIFTQDGAVILQAHQYLKAYAIDTFFVSFMFCFVGYYNGCGRTVFVMVQGLIGGIAVRAPLVFVMHHFFGSNLFAIGLSTPMATLVQIILCLWYYRRMVGEGALVPDGER